MTASDSTIQFRADQLEAMHKVMTYANDEELYFSWILVVPDEPSREDFESLAENEDDYKSIVHLFLQLVGNKNYLV